MHLHRVAAVVALFVVAGCSRDLTLPPPPGPLLPGTISGRVVFAEVGSSVKKPAVGAGIELLTTSISAIADADGRFVLNGINDTDGVVLIRFGLRADGTFARQRLLQLKDIGAGPGHDISLGEISVVENAQVRGKVLRSNIVTNGGHGGTTIFVPEGPFATASADDGSYLLPALPEGTIQLVIFRPGYKAVSLEDVSLRSGEDLTLRTVSLEVDPTPQTPARVAGTVATNPALTDLSAGSVEFIAPGETPLTATLSANGAFELPSVPAGIYTITALHPQYTPATLHNFLVASGGNYTLAQITLTTSPLPPQPDAGQQQTNSDAGTGDGGINGNLAPIAHAGPDQIVRTGSVAQLNASASLDPENKALRYSWVELSDAGVTLSSNNSLLAVSPTFTAPAIAQQLKFRLTVTDDGDLTSSDDVIIEALRPPLARITPNSVTVLAGQSTSLTFDSVGSSDPSGAPLTFAWSVGPGLTLTPTSSATGATYTVSTPATGSGQASVRLIVSNGFLFSDPVDAKITIGGGVPTASVNAGPDQTIGFGVPTTLQATATSASPGSVFAYSWTQIAGSAVTLTGATTNTLSFTAPTTPDTLTFRCDAIGTYNESGFDEVTVTVKDVTAPVVTNTDPGSGGIGSPLSATVTFSEDLDSATVLAANIRVVDSTMAVVPAALRYDAVTDKVSLAYSAPLTANAAYTLKIDNVKDLAGNAVASLSVPFTARNFLFPVFGDTFSSGQASVSTVPYILWTPTWTYVVGRRNVTPPLASYQAYFIVWKVNPNTGLLDTLPYFTSNQPLDDIRSGDIGPRALRTASTWYALIGISNGGGGFPLYAYSTVGETFAPVTGFPGIVGLSDGVGLWGSYENYGLNVRPHIPSMNTFGPEQKIDANCCRTSRISGDGDGNVFYVASWANGTTPTTYNRKTWIFKNTGGSWAKFGEAGTGSPSDVLQGRLRVHNGLPVLVQPESTGGNYQIRAYAWNGTTMAEVGGGALNSVGSVTVFDAAVLADTLYVAVLSGNDVKVRYVSLTSPGAVWTDLVGPNTGGAMNNVYGCAADRPSLDAAPDALWLAWSESCGGTTNWKTFARKIY